MSFFSRRTLYSSLLAFNVAILGWNTGCNEADSGATSKSPPAANINGDRNSGTRAGENSPPAKRATPDSADAAANLADDASAPSEQLDLTVPKGDADKLSAFLQKLSQYRPDDDSPQSVAQFVQAQKAILEAADLLLANKDLDEDTRVKTMVMKWNASYLLFNLDDPGSEERFLAVANELAKDKNAGLARSARLQLRQFEISRSLSSLLQGTSQNTDKLMEDLQLLLSDENPAVDEFSLAQKAARVLEALGKYDEAKQVYAGIAKTFGQSENAQIAEIVAHTTQTATTRLGWLGKQAELTGKQRDGKPFDLAEQRGKVVLVDFWATWCGPCIVELPNVIENYNKYHDRGFEVVGISLDSDQEKLDEFLAKRNIPWTTLWTEEIAAQLVDDPFLHPLAQKYGVDGIPATYLVDQEGKVVSLGIRGERLGEKLSELLGEPDEVKTTAAAE